MGPARLSEFSPKTERVRTGGILHVKETVNAMAGVATTGLGGTILVPNTRVTATTKFTLTVQDGGAAPTNGLYVSARVVGASFTIQMISPSRMKA